MRLRSAFDIGPQVLPKSSSSIFAKHGFYWALLALAVLINVAGYGLGMWHDETLFDELVHFYTSFAGVAAIGRLALANEWLPRAASRPAVLLTIAVALGIIWEAFEYAIGIVGSRHDTLMDLAMDLTGATLAAVLIAWVAGRTKA